MGRRGLPPVAPPPFFTPRNPFSKYEIENDKYLQANACLEYGQVKSEGTRSPDTPGSTPGKSFQKAENFWAASFFLV